MEEPFRQSRKPMPRPVEESPSDLQTTGQVPAVLLEAIRRQQAEAERPTNHMGSTKYESLLAGIKEITFKYEEVQLPSKGKFYSGGTAPSDGVIHVKCMTGEDESVLATARNVKKGQAIDMIFKNCVQENIRPEQLLIWDRTWLLIYLRGISYGRDYEVDVHCTECNQRFSTMVDLDLPVNYCPDNFGPSNLQGQLPVSQYPFTYRLPTGKDEHLISDYREEKIKNHGMEMTNDTWAYRVALLLEDIDGLTDKRSLQQLVIRLSMNDVTHVRNTLNEQPFGADTNIGIMCPYCAETFIVDLPMETGFFFPKGKTKMKGDTPA